MKFFLLHGGRSKRRGGFSLAETTLSIGVFSFGFLSVAPLLALSLKDSRQARDDRMTAQIARTLIEEAQQGVLPAGAAYFDSSGASCDSAQAVFTATGTPATSYLGNGSLTQLTLRVIPAGAPDRVRTYAAVYPAPPTP